MKATSIAAATLILLGCAGESRVSDAVAVDIATVLASPDAYDGDLIRINGAAVVRFEASFICPTSELVDADGTKNCLSLVPGELGGKAYDIRPLHGKLVEIVGRFDSKHFGHMGAYGGSIAAIWGKVLGSHGLRNVPPPPPPPPESSANNSFKPKPLRGSA